MIEVVNAGKTYQQGARQVHALRDVSLKIEKGEDYTYGGVTVIHVKKAKVVLAKDYIFDTEVLKKALGESQEGGKGSV